MSLDLDQLESEAKEEYVIGLDGITRQKKLSLRILILISELRQARERIEKKQIRIEAMSEEMMRVVKKDERLASAEEALKYYCYCPEAIFIEEPEHLDQFTTKARAHFEKYGEKK